MRNLHKLYYKDYYKGVEFSLDNKGVVKAKGSIVDIVKESRVADGNVPAPDFLSGRYSKGGPFYKSEFEVQYPGLVTGVGINHNVRRKELTGEFKLGMHFDYTYGQPVIYGSSVKGVLRSYFKEEYGGEDADAIIADIFEGKDYQDRNTPLEKRRLKPMYERDVFFDAIVVEPNKKGKILDADAIAPHGGDSHDNPFAEPVPIPFIKIASGMKLLFRFKLNEIKQGDTVVMSADKKLKLFVKILTTYGIGAKTNVGYGQLKSV